jgi:hypothetical protein
MESHENHTSQTAVTEDPPVCIAPVRCWQLKSCVVERNRLKKEGEVPRAHATSCFLSLMTWAKAGERLQ